jgi:hypothetical protein
LDSLTLRKMIDYAETAIRWANEVGSDWAEQEQVRAAVAMYVGQVGEIINHDRIKGRAILQSEHWKVGARERRTPCQFQSSVQRGK